MLKKLKWWDLCRIRVGEDHKNRVVAMNIDVPNQAVPGCGGAVFQFKKPDKKRLVIKKKKRSKK